MGWCAVVYGEFWVYSGSLLSSLCGPCIFGEVITNPLIPNTREANHFPFQKKLLLCENSNWLAFTLSPQEENKKQFDFHNCFHKTISEDKIKLSTTGILWDINRICYWDTLIVGDYGIIKTVGFWTCLLSGEKFEKDT